MVYYVFEHQSIMSSPFLNGENAQELELHKLEDGAVGGLVYDWIHEAVIFSNIELGMIVQVAIADKEVEVLFSSIVRPRKLAIQGNIKEQ